MLEALRSVSPKQGIANQDGGRNSSPQSEQQTLIGVKTYNEAGQELNPWKDRRAKLEAGQKPEHLSYP